MGQFQTLANGSFQADLTCDRTALSDFKRTAPPRPHPARPNCKAESTSSLEPIPLPGDHMATCPNICRTPSCSSIPTRATAVVFGASPPDSIGERSLADLLNDASTNVKPLLARLTASIGVTDLSSCATATGPISSSSG